MRYAKDTKMFSTHNLALAAWLIAAKKLRFTHIDPHGSSPADICFDDPNNKGKDLELAFINGNDPVDSARVYHLELRALRKRIQIATSPVPKNGGR
jgi:hypothetical protein